MQGRLDNPRGLEEATEEFGGGISSPLAGWSSLSKALELAVAVGPLVLLAPQKLSTKRISRARLAAVSCEKFYIFHSSAY